MPRWLKTARKSTGASVRALINEEVTAFRLISSEDNEPLLVFVSRYVNLWKIAHPFGVSEYEGIMRLIDYLPDPWSKWAKEEAEHFTWHSLPDYIKCGNMHEFMKVVFEALVDTTDGLPPMKLEELPTRKRAREEANDLDSSEKEKEDEMVDKHMIEPPPVVRHELVRIDEEEEEEDPEEEEEEDPEEEE